MENSYIKKEFLEKAKKFVNTTHQTFAKITLKSINTIHFI